jgi:hypothetical protein
MEDVVIVDRETGNCQGQQTEPRQQGRPAVPTEPYLRRQRLITAHHCSPLRYLRFFYWHYFLIAENGHLR